jgi:hypothetical protein
MQKSAIAALIFSHKSAWLTVILSLTGCAGALTTGCGGRSYHIRMDGTDIYSKPNLRTGSQYPTMVEPLRIPSCTIWENPTDWTTAATHALRNPVASTSRTIWRRRASGNTYALESAFINRVEVSRWRRRINENRDQLGAPLRYLQLFESVEGAAVNSSARRHRWLERAFDEQYYAFFTGPFTNAVGRPALGQPTVFAHLCHAIGAQHAGAATEASYAVETAYQAAWEDRTEVEVLDSLHHTATLAATTHEINNQPFAAQLASLVFQATRIRADTALRDELSRRAANQLTPFYSSWSSYWGAVEERQQAIAAAREARAAAITAIVSQTMSSVASTISTTAAAVRSSPTPVAPALPPSTLDVQTLAANATVLSQATSVYEGTTLELRSLENESLWFEQFQQQSMDGSRRTYSDGVAFAISICESFDGDPAIRNSCATQITRSFCSAFEGWDNPISSALARHRDDSPCDTIEAVSIADLRTLTLLVLAFELSAVVIERGHGRLAPESIAAIQTTASSSVAEIFAQWYAAVLAQPVPFQAAAQ